MKTVVQKIFLDTTFLLPFFGIRPKIKKYSSTQFKETLKGFKEIHITYLSVYETKAKIFRMHKKGTISRTVLDKFWYALKILLEDKRFFFHTYDESIDKNLNDFLEKYSLDIFDALILASAVNKTDILLTEDSSLLSINKDLENKIRIKNWEKLKNNHNLTP